MKSAAIIVAASMAMGGIIVMPARAAIQGTAAAPATAPATMASVARMGNPAPGPMTAQPARVRIQGTISDVVQTALTPKSMHRLVGLFSDAQQQRIAKTPTYGDGYGQKLNARIESIAKLWKQKYGHDFAIQKAHDVLDQAFASIEPSGHGNAIMESARVGILGAAHATEFRVPLVCQNHRDWKIEVPSSLTAESLRGNLLLELTAMEHQAARWPADETSAYRMITHRVLVAVLDLPSRTLGVAPPTTQPAAKLAQPAPTPAATPVAGTPAHHWWQFWNW